MKDTREDLLKIYQAMRTDALLELHAQGTLTDEAYAALESVLAGRNVPIPQRPGGERRSTERKTSTLWATRLGYFGATLPVVCLALDFAPLAVKKVCELCWPSAFMLFAANGEFNIAIYLISITANAFIWAGFGWLIGHGLSARKQHDE